MLYSHVIYYNQRGFASVLPLISPVVSRIQVVVHLAPEGMTGAIEMHEGNFHGEDTDYVEMIGRFEYETSGLYCKSDNSIGKNIQVTGRWY